MPDESGDYKSVEFTRWFAKTVRCANVLVFHLSESIQYYSGVKTGNTPLHAKLKTRFAADTFVYDKLETCPFKRAEGISHLFDTLKSAAQSEIKAYFVHASLKTCRFAPESA